MEDYRDDELQLGQEYFSEDLEIFPAAKAQFQKFETSLKEPTEDEADFNELLDQSPKIKSSQPLKFKKL